MKKAKSLVNRLVVESGGVVVVGGLVGCGRSGGASCMVELGDGGEGVRAPWDGSFLLRGFEQVWILTP